MQLAVAGGLTKQAIFAGYGAENAHGGDVNANDCKVTHEEIARRAYELWQLRGCPLGDGEEDWRAAEDELLGRSHFTGSGDTGLRQAADHSWWSRMLSKIGRAAS